MHFTSVPNILSAYRQQQPLHILTTQPRIHIPTQSHIHTYTHTEPQTRAVALCIQQPRNKTSTLDITSIPFLLSLPLSLSSMTCASISIHLFSSSLSLAISISLHTSMHTFIPLVPPSYPSLPSCPFSLSLSFVLPFFSLNLLFTSFPHPRYFFILYMFTRPFLPCYLPIHVYCNHILEYFIYHTIKPPTKENH